MVSRQLFLTLMALVVAGCTTGQSEPISSVNTPTAGVASANEPTETPVFTPTAALPTPTIPGFEVAPTDEIGIVQLTATPRAETPTAEAPLGVVMAKSCNDPEAIAQLEANWHLLPGTEGKTIDGLFTEAVENTPYLPTGIKYDLGPDGADENFDSSIGGVTLIGIPLGINRVSLEGETIGGAFGGQDRIGTSSDYVDCLVVKTAGRNLGLIVGVRADNAYYSMDKRFTSSNSLQSWLSGFFRNHSSIESGSILRYRDSDRYLRDESLYYLDGVLTSWNPETAIVKRILAPNENFFITKNIGTSGLVREQALNESTEYKFSFLTSAFSEN